MVLADSLKALSLYDNNGWGGTPKEWTWQEQLKAVATNDDLVLLVTSHPNAAARAFSFHALASRKDQRYREILYNSLHDTARFTLKAFDVWVGSNVANYMVSVLVDKLGYMSIQDSITLDSVILYTPNLSHISYLHEILQRLPVDDRYYSRIREMFYDEHYAPALPVLCRYRRDADKTAVIECLLEYSKGLDKENVCTGEPQGRTNEGLIAVALWPDPDFLPALKKVRDYEVKRTHYDYQRICLFYLALMAYDDEQSYQFIEKTLEMTKRNKSTRKYHTRYFGKAYKRNPVPRYKPLLDMYSE